MNDENIFFDTQRLKYRGSNVIIGKTVRIRYPELVELHDNVIIDDFTFISTGLTVKSNSAIEAGCVLMGGKDYTITVEEHCAIAPNCTLLCSSNNFYKSMVLTKNNLDYQFFITGDISFGSHVILGANSVVLPNISIGQGSRIGANSLIKENLDEWTLYAGSPVKPMGLVEKNLILSNKQKYHEFLSCN
jgi:galactoside O-acetyltransferase